MDVTDWMPADLTPEQKAEFAALYPDDDHAAAAAAWEYYAATVPPSPSDNIKSVRTGNQTVTYNAGGSTQGSAFDRANWHRARARVRSVELGPTYARSWEVGDTGPQDQTTGDGRTVGEDQVDAWGESRLWQRDRP